MKSLEVALEDSLDTDVISMRGVSGGDMAEAFMVELTGGHRIFVKTHTSPPQGFFSREAADLGWLDDAAALRVPKVLAVSDGSPAFLCLEWIESDGRRSSDEAVFGQGLARLHQAGAPSFGRMDARTTGSLALPNDPVDSWVKFFAERRLLPLARMASDRASLPDRSIVALEDVADKLAELGGPEESPARLHGDLWAGNRMLDAHGRSWLIDPAAHGGHREFDLAMMRLFGGFGDAAFSAYDEVYPLADGWQHRSSLHQLAPLVVHAIKFGAGYVAAVDDALCQLVS
jgi:fructosamine-3-kinase